MKDYGKFINRRLMCDSDTRVTQDQGLSNSKSSKNVGEANVFRCMAERANLFLRISWSEFVAFVCYETAQPGFHCGSFPKTVIDNSVASVRGRENELGGEVGQPSCEMNCVSQ